jgi:hypothetical protein
MLTDMKYTESPYDPFFFFSDDLPGCWGHEGHDAWGKTLFSIISL